MVDHLRSALLIGLDGKTKPVPAIQRRIGEGAVDHIEREFQPVDLLGIDREIELMRLGHLRKPDEVGHQFRENLVAVGGEISRMQRRELDRDARAVRQLAAGRPCPPTLPIAAMASA
jgi:hypothetical protein